MDVLTTAIIISFGFLVVLLLIKRLFFHTSVRIQKYEPTLQERIYEAVLVGDMYAMRGDFENAIKYYRYAGENGHLKSLMNIGFIFYDHLNEKKHALKYFKKVRELSNILAGMYRGGPVPPDIRNMSLESKIMVNQIYNETSRYTSSGPNKNAYNEFYNRPPVLVEQQRLAYAHDTAPTTPTPTMPFFPPFMENLPTINDIRNYEEVTPIETQVIRNDPQNIHDHNVQNSISVAINNLKSISVPKADNIPKSKVFDDISGYISTLSTSSSPPSPQRVKDAMDVLEHVRNIKDTKITRLNDISLEDTTALIWSRINSRDNVANMGNLASMFVEELASCKENGTIICPSGITTRLIQTLEETDTIPGLVSIKPTWAVRQELLSKASVIREAFEKETKEEQERKEVLEAKKTQENTPYSSYDAIATPHAPPPPPTQKDTDELLRRRIIRDLKKEYVEKGVLKEEDLMAEVSQWINHI